MKKAFFITGTDTGVGKTILTALLARFLRERGVRVAAFKPVCSGGREDAQALYRALGGALTLDEINPWHFRAALAPALAARRERRTVSLTQIVRHVRAISGRFEVTLIEGAGGLLSPLGEHFDSRDLLKAVGAQPILVAQNTLGAVNHVLLTLSALPKGLRAHTPVVLMNPAKPDAATATNAALLNQWAAQTCLRLPWLGTDILGQGISRRPQVKRILAALLRY